MLGSSDDAAQRQVSEVTERVTSIVQEMRGENNTDLTVLPKDAERFFVDIVRKEFSQQLTAKCMCCKLTLSSTGATRLAIHLSECPLLPTEAKSLFEALRRRSDSKRKAKQDAVHLAQQERQAAIDEHMNKLQKLRQRGIKSAFALSASAEADRLIAKFLYANALPFTVADSDPSSLYQQMIKAIKETPDSYVPPNAKKIAGPLLDECYENMWSEMKARDPDGVLRSKFGAAYVSDGWDSIDKKPLVNSAFICGNDGGVYWRSVDTSGKTKNAEYLAALMIEDIYNYGCVNVWL